MSIHLPPPIDLYFKAENSGDVKSLSECFAPDAIVRDEGRTYEGLTAIEKYNHTVALLEIGHRGDKTILKARLTGDFPGSPMRRKDCISGDSLMSDHAYTSPQSRVNRPCVTDILPEERKSLMADPNEQGVVVVRGGAEVFALRRGVADSGDEAGDRSGTSGGHRPVSQGLIIG